jgi:protein-disulfide isomerase
LKQGQQAIQRQLQQILELLKPEEEEQQIRQVVMDLTGQPYKGSADSQLVMVEFSDYQCPYCARHVQSTEPRIYKEYVETGKVAHYFMDMPLEAIHKDAFNAALAANCADEQDRFWPMHDLLFKNRSPLKPENLKSYASELNLDLEKFDACFANEETAKKVRSDLSAAAQIRANGTPNFWFGYRDAKEPNKATLVQNLRGAQPFATFKKVLDGLLEKEGN